MSCFRLLQWDDVQSILCWLLRACLLCVQDFMNNVCTNVLRLHQKKLIPYGGELIHISCAQD